MTSQNWNEAERFSDLLSQHGLDRADLAQSLGISRTTLWRKITSFDASVLHEVAAILDIAYTRLLLAVMVETGVIDSPADLIVGLPVTVVVADRPVNEGRALAVFGAEADADAYARFLDTEIALSASTATLQVAEPGTLPAHMRTYTARWTHRADSISVADRVYRQTPASWSPGADGVPRSFLDITVAATETGSGVTCIEASAPTADRARAAVEAAIARYRALLAAPTFDDTPNGLADLVGNTSTVLLPDTGSSELDADIAEVRQILDQQIHTVAHRVAQAQAEASPERPREGGAGAFSEVVATSPEQGHGSADEDADEGSSPRLLFGREAAKWEMRRRIKEMSPANYAYLFEGGPPPIASSRCQIRLDPAVVDAGL